MVPSFSAAGEQLLALAQKDSPRLRLVAATRGGEFHGPCPKCGGNDRFSVQPERGLWRCRQCSPNGRWSDPPGYLMWRDGVGFKQAVEALGLTLKQAKEEKRGQADAVTPPSGAWRHAAERAVAIGEELLWSPAGNKARTWLLEERLLLPETIRKARLGWFDPEAEGQTHTELLGTDGREVVKLSIPRGILIPRVAIDGGLWGLKTATGRPGRKYEFISGSRGALTGFIADRDSILITEGEFDMFLAWQEVGHLVDVATFGAAASPESVDEWVWGLPKYPVFLLAPDADRAGDRAADAWRHVPSIRLVLDLERGEGKDVTDFIRRGGDLPTKVRCALLKTLGLHGNDGPYTSAPALLPDESAVPQPQPTPEPEPVPEPAPPAEAGTLFAQTTVVTPAVVSAVDTPYALVEDDGGVRAMLDDLAGYDGPLALDTETTGLDPLADQLLLVQIGRPGMTWMLDARVCYGMDAPWWGALQGRPCLLQNSNFDTRFLAAHGVSVTTEHDTMVAELLLRAGQPKERGTVGLAALCEKYLGIKMDKTQRMTFVGHTGPFTEQQLAYAARDVQALFAIRAAQMPLLEQAGLLPTLKLEMSLIPAVAQMELTGITLDLTAWAALTETARAERDRLALLTAEALDGAGNRDLFGNVAIKLSSNEQVLAALKRLGLPVENTMEATLLPHKAHPAVDLLLKWREQDTFVTNFGEKLPKMVRADTGRIHATFNPMATDTGRFSASNPNLQQIPHEAPIRACFTAGEGKTFVVADYSQIELRILAHFSEDRGMIEAFRDGRDLHQATAAAMYKVPFDQVTKDLRTKAKTISFGLVYGRGAKSLAGQVNTTEEEAEALIKQYFAAYPKVSKWLKDQGTRSIKDGECRTILGRRRLLQIPLPVEADWKKRIGDARRQGINSPVQGTSGDMTKLAMCMLHRTLPDSAAIVLTVHDELCIECDLADAERVKHLVDSCMVKAGETFIPSVPVVVESQITRVWAK